MVSVIDHVGLKDFIKGVLVEVGTVNNRHVHCRVPPERVKVTTIVAKESPRKKELSTSKSCFTSLGVKRPFS